MINEQGISKFFFQNGLGLMFIDTYKYIDNINIRMVYREQWAMLCEDSGVWLGCAYLVTCLNLLDDVKE